MLVLRRRAGEAIIVAGDIQIEVIEISRTRVKLGVTAPRTVSVERREVVAVAAENRLASDLLAMNGEGIKQLLVHAPAFDMRKPQVSGETADM